MNSERRLQIDGIIAQLEEAQSNVTMVQEEEQDYFDEMPEGLQGSEKGDRASEVSDELMDIDTGLMDLIERLAGCKE